MITCKVPKLMPRFVAPFLIFLLSLPLGSCVQERDRAAEIQKIIRERVAQRLVEYRDIRMQRCREELVREATRRADSIILVQAELNRDTLARPPKPVRPERPKSNVLPDTTPLRPLLPRDTTRQ